MFKKLHALVTMLTNAEADILADEAMMRKRAAANKTKAAHAKTVAIAQACASLLEEGVPPVQEAPQASAATLAGAEGGLSREQYAHHLRTSALVHHPMHPLNPATSHLFASLSKRTQGLDAQLEAVTR